MGLKEHEDALVSEDIGLFGVSADPPKRLAKFREQFELPYVMLCDPDLVTADRFDIPTQSVHPMSVRYKRGAFLQPALLVFGRGGELAHEWRQTPRMTNMYGATGRPDPDEIAAAIIRVADADR